MLPWGHVAIGYLCYSLAIRFREKHPPQGIAVLTLAIGTQFPDLIDKPLGTGLDVLPSGRSLAHSLLFAFVLGIIVWTLANQYDRQLEGTAFVAGHSLHLVGDTIPVAIAGRWEQGGFLLWPLVPASQYSIVEDQPFLEYLAVHLTSGSSVEFALFGLAILLWVYDGRPGIGLLRSWISSSTHFVVDGRR